MMGLDRRSVLGLVALLPFAKAEARVANQTEKLQAKIDKAAKTTGRVVLEAGEYNVGTLKIRSTLTFEGWRGRSVLQSLKGEPILQISDAASVTISGLSFESGNLTPEDGAGGAGGTSDNDPKFQILATQCTDLVIENCIFQNAQTSALGLDACTGRVTGNVFSKIEQAGILAGQLYGKDAPSRGLVINGNHLSDIGNNGIVIKHYGAQSEEDGSIVTNNHIERVRSVNGNGQHGNGIYVFASDKVIVTGNKVTDTDYSGVRCTSCIDVLIANNVISRSSETAIFVEFAFKSVIVNANIVDDSSSGIELSGGDGVVGFSGICSNNIVRNIQWPSVNPDLGKHIGINITSNNTVGIGNVVDKVETNAAGPGIGIMVQDWSASHYHAVQNNMIHGAAVGIAVVISANSGSATISVTGNTISAAGSAAIQQFSPAFQPIGEDLLQNNILATILHLADNVVVK